MMNNMVFSTGGDWDSTTLFNNGQEVMAAQLFVELHAGRNEWGDPDNGGVQQGGTLTALVRPQYDPNEEIGILPGRLEMNFPGHSLIIENHHPGFVFEATRIWFDGRDVTDMVMDIYVDINAVDNIVEAHVTIFKDHWFRADEVATYRLI